MKFTLLFYTDGWESGPTVELSHIPAPGSIVWTGGRRRDEEDSMYYVDNVMYPERGMDREDTVYLYVRPYTGYTRYAPMTEADRIVDRICGLRVFEDANGKMNVNPADAGAELLIVSQFTLFADCRSRRPGYTAAARPETAVPLYERVIAGCEARGFRTGVFGADMKVASVNDGPVTILLDTDHL